MVRATVRALLLCSLFLAAGCPPEHPSGTTPLPPVTRHVSPQTDPAELIIPAPSLVPANVITTTQSTVEIPPPADDWQTRSIVTYLASDALEGRGIGMHGLDTAAEFLATRLHDAGLNPVAGLDGYFQPFDYAAARAASPDCTLTLNGSPLILNQDFVPLSFSGEGNFNAQIISAGFGITDKQKGYDDYAKIDAHGKIVLVQRFEPMDPSGASLFSPANGADWSSDAQLESKAANAAAHGAVAMLLVTPPQLLREDDPLIPFTRFFKGNSASIPVLHVKARSQATAAGMSGVASGRVTIQQTIAHLKNVVASIPGSGPDASQVVVVGAHYDHLGRGQLGGQIGAIYHGADDNASGVTAVLDLARRLRSQPPPHRTIVFCFFSAEEEGLIGSEYFVNHPPTSLSTIVAMLNLDMVGRIRNEIVYVGGQGTAPGLDSLVEDAARGLPLRVRPMEADGGGRGGLGPTDQMSFALKHIPVLCLFSGLHADYHRSTDTADKINFAGIDEVVDLSARLVSSLSSMSPQAYDSSADLTRFAMMKDPASDRLPGASLGIIPDSSAGAIQAGVLVQGVRPDSPASRAGLEPGDLIVEFTGKPLQTLDQLSEILAKLHGGEHVRLRVLRQNKSLELTADLIARKD